MSEERKQFTFYRSFYEAFKDLPDDTFASAVRAVCEYALNGVEIELDPIPRAFFTLIKPTLNTAKRKSESGKTGGEVKQSTSKRKANRKQSASKTQANGKQTASEKEKEVESEKEKEVEVEIEIENECSNIPPLDEGDNETPAPPPKPPKEKHKYGEFENVLLTDDEFSKLENEYPQHCQKYIDKLSMYMKSTGKHYASHYVTILNWLRRDNVKTASDNAVDNVVNVEKLRSMMDKI